MKVIFAQGNPGQEFNNSRHNVGFLVVDTIADARTVSFSLKSKFNAHIAEVTIASEKTLLVKPTTFYNETGQSLRSIVDFYKVDIDDVLVLHDELMLPFGKIRVRHSGRDAGNNGIKSLNSHIGDNFARIRIGVQNDLRSRMGDTDFVLGKFSSDEQKLLKKDIVPAIMNMVEQFANDDLKDESISLVTESTE